HRRLGDLPKATQSWSQALERAIECAQQKVPIRDPLLWERAVALRPPESEWPDNILNALSQILNDPVNRNEVLVQRAIAHWRLARREFQGALLAAKKAETDAIDNGPLLLIQAK